MLHNACQQVSEEEAAISIESLADETHLPVRFSSTDSYLPSLRDTEQVSANELKEPNTEVIRRAKRDLPDCLTYALRCFILGFTNDVQETMDECHADPYIMHRELCFDHRRVLIID